MLSYGTDGPMTTRLRSEHTEPSLHEGRRYNTLFFKTPARRSTLRPRGPSRVPGEKCGKRSPGCQILFSFSLARDSFLPTQRMASAESRAMSPSCFKIVISHPPPLQEQRKSKGDNLVFRRRSSVSYWYTAWWQAIHLPPFAICKRFPPRRVQNIRV